MAEGKKYKIKIVKTGVGDPFVAFAFYFKDKTSNHTDPSTDNISEINFSFNITDNNLGSNYAIGHANINLIKTQNQMVVIIPWDEINYTEGQDVTVKVSVSDSHGDQFKFDEPDSIPAEVTYNIPDSYSNYFTVDLVSGISSDLQLALESNGWISGN